MCIPVKRSISIAALLAAALAAPVQSETLAEAWALALRNDNALAAARLDVEAAELEVKAARAARYPTLSVNGSFVQLRDAPAFDFSGSGIPLELSELIDNDNTFLGGVNVTLPLYTGGRIAAAVRAAGENQKARAAEEAQLVQAVKLAVAQAYVEVLRAERALDVADSNVASLEGYVSETRSMFEREAVPRNDLLAAQVALADARQNRIRAQNALSIARAVYNRRLDQPLDREAVLDGELPALAQELERMPVEQLIARALEQRSELDALEAQARAVGHFAEIERARVRPQLALNGGYTYLENQALDRENFASASISFQWPLFDGGTAHNRSASLRRSQRALEQRRADLEGVLALEVRQSWLEVQETTGRIDATAEAVAQSEENLRIARQQYLAGLVTSTRVLEAESLRVVSRTNHDNAILDASLARYRLAKAVGEL